MRLNKNIKTHTYLNIQIIFTRLIWIIYNSLHHDLIKQNLHYDHIKFPLYANDVWRMASHQIAHYHIIAHPPHHNAKYKNLSLKGNR